jgi:hypothetical protein
LEEKISVADPDPGSGSGIPDRIPDWIPDWVLFDPWIRDLGSGIWNRFFPDPGSQDHIFKSFLTIFLKKKFYNSLKIGPNFFLQHFKAKIIYNFVKFVAT